MKWINILHYWNDKILHLGSIKYKDPKVPIGIVECKQSINLVFFFIFFNNIIAFWILESSYIIGMKI